jgi:hypothetical protein
MSNIQIVEPEIKDLQVSNGDMSAQVAALRVTDDASFALGGAMLLEIKKRYKLVEERFAEPVSLAHKAHKAMTSLRDSVLSPLKQYEAQIKGQLGTYQMEVERKRREEAERLRRQAEAQAEADRIAKAQDQMDKGDLKACEKTLSAPIQVEPVRIVTPEPPKVAGVSFKDDWRFEIENVNLIPIEYMVPDEKAIARVVKALGSKTNIPGIRVWAEKVVSGRAA